MSAVRGMNDYMDILKRLETYRERMGKTKKEMAKMFGVHETHYGKLESGIVRITYERLQCFASQGGDIYYLFTGYERESGPVKDYLARCATQTGREIMLHILMTFIEFGNWLDGTSREKDCLDKMPPTIYRSLRLMELEGKKYSIWERIRRMEWLTQIQMADILDIDVKRYRAMEKEKRLPTAELIYAMYRHLDYSPQLFLDRETFYVDELNHYWNQLSDMGRRYLEFLMELIFCGIEKMEEDSVQNRD